MSDDRDPPRYDGVRCQCGNELVPYVLTNGDVGIHFMDESDSRGTETLQAIVLDQFDGWSCPDGGLDPDGIAHILEFRRTLSACVDLIDYELSVRHVREDSPE